MMSKGFNKTQNPSWIWVWYDVDGGKEEKDEKEENIFASEVSKLSEWAII